MTTNTNLDSIKTLLYIILAVVVVVVPLEVFLLNKAANSGTISVPGVSTNVKSEVTKALNERDYQSFGNKFIYETIEPFTRRQNLEMYDEAVKSGIFDENLSETDLAKLKENLTSELAKLDDYKLSGEIAGNPGAETPADNSPLSQSDIQSILADFPIKGESDAKYLAVEYSDLECPFCKKLKDDGSLESAIASFDEEVGYLFKHFPLEQIHPGARAKSNAVECAREMNGDDAYFAFVDGIFAKANPSNGSLAMTELEGISNDLGLDYAELKSCYESGKYDSKVTSSLNEGISKFGIGGTPNTILINRETGEYVQISGAVGAANFTSALNQLKS